MPSPNLEPLKAAVFALTTDNTQTTLVSFLTRSNKAYIALVKVLAVKTSDFNVVAGYDLEGVYKNVGGTLALVQSTVNSRLGVTGEDAAAAAWDATLDASSGSIRCLVTGANSVNITWHAAEVKIYEGGQIIANFGATI